MLQNLENLTRAELLALVRRLQSSKHAPQDTQQLVHDLRVHQEELEAQAQELQRAQATVEESRDRFADLFDYAPLIYLGLDGQGVVQTVNLLGASLLGLETARVVDYPFTTFVLPDDRPLFLDHMRRCRLSAGTVNSEMRLRGAQGQIVPSLLVSRPATHPVADHKIFLTVITDLTEQKCTEDKLRSLNAALEQRTQQLRKLASELTSTEERERRRLAQVLHDDLQQLLVAARMHFQMLPRPAVTDDVHDPWNQVDALLRDAIASSRSLTKELTPPILYDGGLGAALRWLVRRVAEKHNLRVHLRVEPGADPPDHDIAALLFQATRELLFNVVKHSGVNEARLTLTTADDGQVQIQIEDHGSGFVLDAARQRSADGTSFGLFSIEQRLEVLGGRMEVLSAKGRGTRITMSAPRRRPGDERPGPALVVPHRSLPTAPGAPIPPGGPIRIILADDHRILREGLAGLLRSLPDMKLEAEAEDGEQAVALAHQLRPQVVVMDVSMPRVSGVEATRRIHEQLPDVKVIGLSMHERDDMQVAMRQAGAVAYLTKDGPADRLIATIRQVAAAGQPTTLKA